MRSALTATVTQALEVDMRVYLLRLVWSDLYMGFLKDTFFCTLSYGRHGWLKRLTLRSGTGRLWRALCPGLSLMWMWNALPGESTGANPDSQYHFIHQSISSLLFLGTCLANLLEGLFGEFRSLHLAVCFRVLSLSHTCCCSFASVYLGICLVLSYFTVCEILALVQLVPQMTQAMCKRVDGMLKLDLVKPVAFILLNQNQPLIVFKHYQILYIYI